LNSASIVCGGMYLPPDVLIRSFFRSVTFDDAVAARDFDAHLEDIRTAAGSTTRHGRLAFIGQYQVGPLRYLRLNFTTGDAAGQNMWGKAALAASAWIQEDHAAHPRFLLSGNIDTDKLHSRMNMLHTRGRRVVAEAVVRRDVLQRLMRRHHRPEPDAHRLLDRVLPRRRRQQRRARRNGLAAMFIACGQDAANVAESHAGLVYTRLLDDGDYYWFITLPALIVATVGGGTGLPTQHECLAMLGCAGPGKADKLAEIVAAVVLAGETSLASAILAGEWVNSHERMGRNRPTLTGRRANHARIRSWRGHPRARDVRRSAARACPSALHFAGT
jgi:hydroxymethylglutaryl-CoA reductase (NADPH)